jgi:hypothetical protein
MGASRELVYTSAMSKRKVSAPAPEKRPEQGALDFESFVRAALATGGPPAPKKKHKPKKRKAAK